MWIALACWTVPALLLLWIFLDDRARVRAYRTYREQEDKRLSGRTPREIETDAQLACILFAGDFFPFVKTPKEES